MMRYTTLLIDADGTLLDFDAAEKQALKATFKQYGLPFDENIEQTYLQLNKRLWNAYERGEIDRNTLIYTRFVKLFQLFDIKEDGIAFEDDYQLALGRGHQVMPHAMEVIQALKQTHALYIVTNGVIATQYTRLNDSGLDQYFNKVFVSEEIGYRKPMKEYFDYVFQNIQDIDLTKTLIIGDSLASDIAGGNVAGIDTCWYHAKPKVNDQGVHVTYEISDLRELYAIVKGE